MKDNLVNFMARLNIFGTCDGGKHTFYLRDTTNGLLESQVDDLTWHFLDLLRNEYHTSIPIVLDFTTKPPY